MIRYAWHLSGDDIGKIAELVIPWTEGKKDEEGEIIPGTTVHGEITRIEHFKTRDGYINYMQDGKVRQFPTKLATSLHIQTSEIKNEVVIYKDVSLTLPATTVLDVIN